MTVLGIEIIAIGNEILSGNVINTNASYISQALLQKGFSITSQSVVGDDPSAIRKTISHAITCSNIVICTGGLGPTCDDCTKNVVSELLNSELKLNQELFNELKKRYGNFTTLENQSTVPVKASLIKNENGTAPGFIFKTKIGFLILLPGVPTEMKTMLKNEVLPFLDNKFKDRKKTFVKNLLFFELAEHIVDPLLISLKNFHPHVDFGIYPGQGVLEVRLTAKEEELLKKPYEVIKDQFGKHQFEAPSRLIEEAVSNGFTTKKRTLAVAESCTGGAISARLTQIPGASQYFLGSVIAYSNELKESLLGVPRSILESKGAVSKETAILMCKGIQAKINCDFSAAVTGIAGPTGGTEDKPVGTVWCAVSQKDKEPITWKIKAYGNREMIIVRSANSILAGLIQAIEDRWITDLLTKN